MKSKETDFKFEHCANYYAGCTAPPTYKIREQGTVLTMLLEVNLYRFRICNLIR